MKMVQVRIDPIRPGSMPIGRIDPVRIDATTEADLMEQQREDDLATIRNIGKQPGDARSACSSTIEEPVIYAVEKS
jgi:hypothetical protein